MKRGQQIVNLLLFSVELLAQKTKAKPSGLPDSNVIFFLATKQTKQKKLGAALGMFYSMHSGGKYQQYKSLVVYPSLVSPEALEDLFSSGGTRTAGSAFGFQQRLKEQQINDLLL